MKEVLNFPVSAVKKKQKTQKNKKRKSLDKRYGHIPPSLQRAYLEHTALFFAL